MKYFASSLTALAFATTAVQVPAQDAGQTPPNPNASAPAQPDSAAPPAAPAPGSDAAPPATVPDATAPPAAATPDAGPATVVSDAEVEHFAKATVAVQKINADAKLDDSKKQQKMAAAVKSSGLEPSRYNEIGKALATDTTLRAKVQTAMAKYAGPDQG
jgi:hypothetical protein